MKLDYKWIASRTLGRPFCSCRFMPLTIEYRLVIMVVLFIFSGEFYLSIRIVTVFQVNEGSGCVGWKRGGLSVLPLSCGHVIIVERIYLNWGRLMNDLTVRPASGSRVSAATGR